MRMNFAQALAANPVMLTEGAMVERLRREYRAALDPHVVHAGFIYDARQRLLLETVYRQYAAIARAIHLPFMLSTPTWRASQERLSAAGLADRDVNGDDYRFLAEIRDSYGPAGERMYIAGMIGPAGDAYQPAQALPSSAAERYHEFQITRLAGAGADLLSALTLPALSEALGIARAMARTGLPYILSFVIRPRGTLLDDTPLGDAIRLIDDTVWPPPTGYMVNCVHPSVLRAALSGSSPDVQARLLGIQANSSRLSPEELDNRAELDAEPPDLVADALWSLHTEHGARILGGCCGTDDRYIWALAERVAAIA